MRIIFHLKNLLSVFVRSLCLYCGFYSIIIMLSIIRSHSFFHQHHGNPRLSFVRLLASRSTSLNWDDAKGGKTLVIVESPAKAKTIQKFVNSESKKNSQFVIDFSAGHIRELASQASDFPKNFEHEVICTALDIRTQRLGVDVRNNFKPIYRNMPGKSDILKRLKEEIKDADRLLLATDEDREGEAISWHLIDVLKPTIPYKVSDL
jgi:hypothetical protein